jgi:hypothetical protein
MSTQKYDLCAMPAADNILFNALKHHRLFIHQQIARADKATLPELLKKLGNSQMDIYYGVLDLPKLFKEVLRQIPVRDEPAYLQWLQESGGYISVTLSDTSRWVLLPGNQPGQYIHLHPARYSPHSMRVKATVLKTAIACMVCMPGVNQPGTIPTLAELNELRHTLLHLSPVKDLEQCEHLWEVLKMLKAQ